MTTHNRQTELALIHCLDRMRQIHFWELCPELTGAEIMLLYAVCQHEQADHPALVSELSACTKMHAAAISRLMSGLEEKGYLRRSPDPACRRYVRVQATEQGRTVTQNCMNLIFDYWDSVFAGVSADDLETILRLWRELAERMETIFEQKSVN